MSTPLFMTNHSPLGAWASLTFGAAGQGVSIDDQRIASRPNGDLFILVTRDGVTTALPFIADASKYKNWRVLGESSVARTMTSCVDEFAAAEAGITLRVFTPHAALPNPKRSGNLQYSTVPGVFLEIVVDNSGSDSPASAFVGLNYQGEEALRPADWSSKTLCGVGKAGDWLLAAAPVKDEVFTVLSSSLEEQITSGTGLIEPGSSSGGVMIKVPPRSKRTVHLAFAFYHAGSATQSGTGTAGR